MTGLIDLAESGRLPDTAIRLGIRRLLGRRLHGEHGTGVADQNARQRALLATLRASGIALDTERANEQHYEVPAAFFEQVLGNRLKYSACLWDTGAPDLNAAEEQMLALYAERAELAGGMNILDLGCGWGSFTLWAAARFPDSRFLAVSNSASQREFIESAARRLGLANVTVVTEDVNRLQLDDRFDRIVSVEMFEHVRNYEQLMGRISSWLTDRGKLFVHIFCHHRFMYPFETEGGDNWMGRLFFTGGLMPARDTLLHFQDHLRLEHRWDVSGTNYQKTARAWLNNLDANHAAVRDAITPVYGDHTMVWLQRWRMFFMACEELFGYRHGNEWLVCHYLFGRQPGVPSPRPASAP